MLKEGRALISQFHRAPMLVCPRLFDFDLLDRLLETAFGDDRDGEPLDAVSGLDAIAIVPMPFHVLRAVIDHVFVATSDQVEKAFPRNVAGLDDGNAHVMITRRPLTDVAGKGRCHSSY